MGGKTPAGLGSTGEMSYLSMIAGGNIVAPTRAYVQPIEIF
jgi:hypothetical protein